MKESYTFNPQATVRICKGRFRCRIVIQHRRLVEGGARIARDGALPINTNGGQLSGGRTHGLGYGHEACTPLWGRGGARQRWRPRGVARWVAACCL